MARFQKGLRGTLKSENPAERKAAITKLGELDTPEAVDFLLHIAKGKARTWVGNFSHAESAFRYGVDDQLSAITALSKIKKRKG